MAKGAGLVAGIEPGLTKRKMQHHHVVARGDLAVLEQTFHPIEVGIALRERLDEGAVEQSAGRIRIDDKRRFERGRSFLPTAQFAEQRCLADHGNFRLRARKHRGLVVHRQRFAAVAPEVQGLRQDFRRFAAVRRHRNGPLGGLQRVGVAAAFDQRARLGDQRAGMVGREAAEIAQPA